MLTNSAPYMPVPQLKSIAAKSGKSVADLEGYWNDAKGEADKKGLTGNRYWAYVSAIVQRRAGVRESLTFKEFIIESDRDHADALRTTGFWGKAGAGCLILARDTGRMCIAHRSRQVEQPGTWGVWGGAIDRGEDPKKAAKREVVEEAGYRGEIEMQELDTFKHESGFRYYTFLGIVEKEFKPRMDWETQGFKWCKLDDLPKPLHFGLKATLAKPEVIAKIEAAQPKS